MSEEEHEEVEEHDIQVCAAFGEQILDGVCQNPRRNAIICSSCQYKVPIEKIAEEIVGESIEEEAPEEETLTEEQPTEEQEDQAWEPPEVENLENQMTELGYSEDYIQGVIKLYS